MHARVLKFHIWISSQEHLGLNLTNACDWLAYIEYIKKKKHVRLISLRSLEFTLKRRSLRKICFIFIRPILEYADIVWDCCTQQQKDELEAIELEAARIVTGTKQLVSIQKTF